MKTALQILLCSALIAPATLLAQQAGGGAMAEDHHVLTGVHDFTLGSPETSRNVLSPSFSVTQQADSNAFFTGAALGWQPVTLLTASISLQHSQKRNSIQLLYNGTGQVYEQQSNLNSHSHSLGISDGFVMGRTSVRLTDNFTYSREATFGASYFQPASTDLNAGVLPNQSILTALAGRISNAAAAEVDYHLSREDTFSLSGTHSLLHFLQGTYLSGDQLGVQAGYNRQIRHATVGASFGFQRWTFENDPIEGRSYSAQFQYGYRVTARLSFQASAGPQITTFNFAIPQRIGLGSHVDLQYQMRATGLRLGYDRGVSGGAGVLATANSDTVTGNVTHRMSRRWNASVDAGFGRNSLISSSALAFAVPGASTEYQTLSAGARVTRDLGRTRQITFSYSFQDQLTGALIGGGGIVRPTRHVVGVGFSWNLKPIGLQ